MQIIFADISMSIDNVTAVAAIEIENTVLLVFGLLFAIMFMAFFSTIIMKLMTKYKWLACWGLLFLIHLAFEMLYDGWPAFLRLTKLG